MLYIKSNRNLGGDDEIEEIFDNSYGYAHTWSTTCCLW